MRSFLQLSALDLHLKGVCINPLFGLSALKSEVSGFKEKSRRPEAVMESERTQRDLHPVRSAAETSRAADFIGVKLRLCRSVKVSTFPLQSFCSFSEQITSLPSHLRDELSVTLKMLNINVYSRLIY